MTDMPLCANCGREHERRFCGIEERRDAQQQRDHFGLWTSGILYTPPQIKETHP